MYLYRFLPISVFFAGGLTLGNSAYQYLSVAYIQMLKSFTPVPMLLVGVLLGKEHPSWQQFIVVLVVSGGLALSTEGELSFSVDGFVLQCLAMLCDVCRINLLDMYIASAKLDSLSTLYYYAPASFVLILIGFFVLEANNFPYAQLSFGFWCLLLLNGLVSLGLNVRKHKYLCFIAVIYTKISLCNYEYILIYFPNV
jgi:drug/metabolite transporter (DMT)-like permease